MDPIPGIYPNSFIIVHFCTKIEFLHVVKCRLVSQSAVISATGSWRSLGEDSGGKSPEKCWPFTSRGQINSLE